MDAPTTVGQYLDLVWICELCRSSPTSFSTPVELRVSALFSSPVSSSVSSFLSSSSVFQQTLRLIGTFCIFFIGYCSSWPGQASKDWQQESCRVWRSERPSHEADTVLGRSEDFMLMEIRDEGHQSPSYQATCEKDFH